MASSSKLFAMPGTIHDVPFPGINEFMFRAPTNLFSEVQFVPEKIVEFCTSPDGIRFYKIQWDKTWISEHYLLQHQNLIDTFWQNQNTQSSCESNDQVLNNLFPNPESSNLVPLYNENSVTTPSVTIDSKPSWKVYSSDLNSSNSETPLQTPTSPNLASYKPDSTLNGNLKRRRRTRSQRTVPAQQRRDLNIIPNAIAKAANKNNTACNSKRVDFNKHLTPAKDSQGTRTDNTSNGGEGSKLTSDRNEVSETSSQNNNKRSIQLDGVELLNVENNFVTDEEIKQHAQELLSSYSKRRPRSSTSTDSNIPQTCLFCQKVVSTRESLRQHHLRLHFKNACPFACTVCEKRFMLRGLLEEHMLAHSDVRNFACKVCGLTFKRRGQLHFHMKKHENQNHFQCCLCDKSFKVETDLQKHCLNGEHQKRTNKCTVCEEILLSPNSLYEHSLMHARQVYVCQTCNASFKTKTHLTLHENKKHSTSDKNYKCPCCDKEFIKVKDFRNHLEQEHKGISDSFKFDYVCTACGKDFAYEGALHNHMKKHLDGTLQKDKNVLAVPRKRKESLARMSNESLRKLGEDVEKIVDNDSGEAKLQCKLCPQVFKYVPAMERHLQQHMSGSLPPSEGNQPNQSSTYQGSSKAISFQCKCKASFKYKSYLLAHQKKCTLAPSKGASKRKGTPNKTTEIMVHVKIEDVSFDDEFPCVPLSEIENVATSDTLNGEGRCSSDHMDIEQCLSTLVTGEEDSTTSIPSDVKTP